MSSTYSRSKPIEERLVKLLADGGQPYDRAWVDRAAFLVADVEALRRRCAMLHRRAQRAESDSLREGKRADRVAKSLRRALSADKC